MFGLTDNILSLITVQISGFSPIQKALVYGSRARGDYKHTSDIDICVLGNDLDDAQLNLLRHRLDGLAIIYKIDLLHFESISNQKIKDNILNEGICIFDRSSFSK